MRMVAMNGPAMENLSLNKARLRASILQLVSRLLPKIQFSETQTAGSLLLFRPDLVITQLPHEHFFVYGLPGVVEHRRDAGRAANFRALPGNDHQRRGRFLIAQNGHAQRFPSRDGSQLPVFVCLSLRFFRWSSFWLCLRRFSLTLLLFCICLRFRRAFLSWFRFC